MCYCGNTGVERIYRNKGRHRKLTKETKILPPLRPGIEPATFQLRVRSSITELSPPRSVTLIDSTGCAKVLLKMERTSFDGTVQSDSANYGWLVG